jgi:oxygen-independent coproporphyrinogen-3 oxidase
MMTDAKKGLYIHFPFCRKKCGYCGFYSVEDLSAVTIERYIDAVISEIESASNDFPESVFDTVFFGGGTPSMAGAERIGRILEVSRRKFSITDNAEITLEMNPSDVTADSMRAYASSGINRFTLGVQTLDRDAYRSVGRQGGFCDDSLLDAYFSTEGVSLCADLIAGIPEESPESFIQGLEKITAYRPDHLSVYLLTLESGSPYERKKQRFSAHDEERQIETFADAVSFLKSKGYLHYEISNFCLPCHESRHNLKYWTWGSYLGLGPAAHSFMNGKRFSNEPSLDAYLRGGSRVFDKRSVLQEASEFIMTGLRLRRGFPIREIRNRFGGELFDRVADDISRLESEGLLEEADSDGIPYLRIPDGKIFVSDDITFRAVQNLL